MKCLTVDVHFIYDFFLKKVIVTTAFSSCSDTYYIAKKRLLAFGRFFVCGSVWEVRMPDKEVWLTFVVCYNTMAVVFLAYIQIRVIL